MDVKQRIRDIIEANDDMTVRSVSLAAGLSDSLLHKFLSNEDQSMTIRNLDKVAEALGVSARFLLFGDDQPAEIIDIWDRIPTAHRPQARDILETFAKKDRA
jgi:transcriptional regulator with XRE-family HTH domain